MNKLLRLLSATALLSIGSLAFAGDQKVDDCKACKEVSSCCKAEKKETSSCCKAGTKDKKAEKKPEQK
jgi:hypothetical protein